MTDKRAPGDDDRKSLPKRLKAEAQCLAVAKVTKSSLVRVLQSLHASGMLSEGMGAQTSRQLRQELRVAQEVYARMQTPYGTLVQSAMLPFDALPKWDFAHPLAMLSFLCNRSPEFSAICLANVANATLHIIVYMDEVKPGNPLRHDAGRSLEAIYWSIVEWPDWMLMRHENWFCLAVVQSKICDKIPGGVSSLTPYVLNMFWPRMQPITVMLTSGQDQVVINLEFVGFIADLDGHAKMGGFKTIAAIKCCVECENVVRFIDTTTTHTLVGIDCGNPAKFVRNTNADVFAKADRLRAAHVASTAADGTIIKGQNTRLAELSTELGVNHNPRSLLMDINARSLYKPVSHTIRDWMHLWVQDGIVGTEMCMLCGELIDHHIPLDVLWKYAQAFSMPRRFGGRPVEQWFTKKSIGDHNIRAFAAEQLSMIPILNTFLQDEIKPHGIMGDHIRCFAMMEELVALASLGPHAAMAHIDRIRFLIPEHAELFVKLYPDQVRPKFHHTMHIVDNMECIKVLISCFVLERKHRNTKAAACETFRFIEHTVIVDLVNRQCTKLLDMSGSSTLRRRFLITQGPSHAQVGLDTSLAACLPIGEVHNNDMVFLSDGTVGACMRFWHDVPNDVMVCLIRPYTKIGPCRWRGSTGVPDKFVDVDEIVATLFWRLEDNGIIRVVVPVLFR